MATVVISERLVGEVTHNVKGMFEARLKEAQKVPDHWGALVQSGIWKPDTLAKIRSLPREYFKWSSTISFTIDGVVSHVNVVLPLDVPLPAKWNVSENGVTANYYVERVELVKSDPRWHKLIAEAQLWKQSQQDIENEMRGAVEQIRGLLRTYRTLAPAIKVYPPLYSLLPREYQARHNEVKDPTKRERVAPELSLENLTASIATKRMTGG